ncbi:MULTISPECIES: TetR/AcrR family transcriptional regulator [Paenibacillus]|uniref:TetR/AcrR family transcriptional regulator n=1 Tax=Paenibacillus residui TaxID=629724 RepID=A0ABW3DAI0_9BACL|nr:TetR/AcrR family transcriptional regulator [Paenibacillus sp. 32O-W]
METRTNRQQKALETKNKLIDAALRTFSRKGFKESTTKDIAKEAGVTDGLIYHYFQSKEDLLWAIFDKYTLLHSLEETVSRLDSNQPLEHNLTIYFQSLFRSLDESQDLIVMCFGEAQRNDDIRRKIQEIIGRGAELLVTFLEPKVRIGRRELSIAVRNLQTAMVFHFLTVDRFMEGGKARQEYIEISVRQLLKIIAE